MVEVILPILCPSDLLDHLTCSPHSSGIGSLVFALWKQLWFWSDGVAAANRMVCFNYKPDTTVLAENPAIWLGKNPKKQRSCSCIQPWERWSVQTETFPNSGPCSRIAQLEPNAATSFFHPRAHPFIGRKENHCSCQHSQEEQGNPGSSPQRCFSS